MAMTSRREGLIVPSHDIIYLPWYNISIYTEHRETCTWI